MSHKVTGRDVIDRFISLREDAATYAERRKVSHDTRWQEINLHHAAIAYASAVRLVVRRGRGA